MQLPSPSIQPYDLFFDTIAFTALYTHSPSYFNPHGILLSINAHSGEGNTPWGNISAFLRRQLVAVVWQT